MSRDRFTEKDENGEWMIRYNENWSMFITRKETQNSDGSKTSTPVCVYSQFIDRLAEYEDLIFSPETLKGIIKEWKEWADAKNDGRLAILPCKVGDMVYYRRGAYFVGDDVKRIVLDGLDNQVIIDHNHAFMFSDFGVKVWASREEAEAALKERYGKHDP